MDYLRKHNILCFTLGELDAFYFTYKRKQILEEAGKRGDPYFELPKRQNELSEIARAVVLKGSKDNSEMDIIYAQLLTETYFPKGSKVGFVMKDAFSHIRVAPSCFEELKHLIKQGDITDFVVLTGLEQRNFQLKRFRNNVDLEELFAFIKSRLKHYGYNLGKINLLIVLQKSGEIDNAWFFEINSRLKKIGLRGEGQILIAFNENNHFHIMNQVYPEITTTRVPINVA